VEFETGSGGFRNWHQRRPVEFETGPGAWNSKLTLSRNSKLGQLEFETGSRWKWKLQHPAAYMAESHDVKPSSQPASQQQTGQPDSQSASARLPASQSSQGQPATRPANHTASQAISQTVSPASQQASQPAYQPVSCRQPFFCEVSARGLAGRPHFYSMCNALPIT